MVLQPPNEARTASIREGPRSRRALEALEALEVLVDEDLAGRARDLGAEFREALAPLRTTPQVREIRGKGLMNAVEFKDPEAHERVRQLMTRGILAKDTHRYAVRLTPPLTIEEGDLMEAAATIVEVFKVPLASDATR